MDLKNKRKNSKNQSKIIIDADDRFAFIAGYTEGGFPYGVTWEEMEKQEGSGEIEFRFKGDILSD